MLREKEKKIGLYATIIFHLVVIIILLLTGISRVVSAESSFILDFTGQQELEQQIKQQQIQEQASKELDELLSGHSSETYRNVAVDRSRRPLKDDRFKNPSQVYDEAKELQKKLDASRREALREQGSDDVALNSNDHEQKTETYKGPSVISYILDGRKAMSLPVPVYKCYGGGDVSVRITVNRKGYVVGAVVISGSSSTDECLIKSALDAAKRSRFAASAKAPEKQIGEIVYRFIAQ